ncbi:5962_t:CDS:1, partial [Acaulospora colombiana]
QYWTQEYQLLNTLCNNVFKEATAEISFDEINNILAFLLKKKSLGLTFIPYKAWINLSSTARNILKTFFNSVLNSSTSPSHWNTQ